MTNDDEAREADYGRHEILDRSEMIMSLVGDYLMEHKDIRGDEKALARRAHDALFRLYQAVGGRHLRGDESPLAQSTGIKRAMSIMMDYAEAYDGISGDDLEDGGPDPAVYIARIVDALESGQPKPTPTQAEPDWNSNEGAICNGSTNHIEFQPTPTQADVDALVRAAGFAANRLAVICESAKHDMATKEKSALSALNAALTPFQKG